MHRKKSRSCTIITASVFVSVQAMIIEIHQFVNELKVEKKIDTPTPTPEKQTAGSSSQEPQVELELSRATKRLHEIHKKAHEYMLGCQGDKPDKKHHKQYKYLLSLSQETAPLQSIEEQKELRELPSSLASQTTSTITWRKSRPQDTKRLTPAAETLLKFAGQTPIKKIHPHT